MKMTKGGQSIFLVIASTLLLAWLFCHLTLHVDIPSARLVSHTGLTIRVNTFRRNDLLEGFLKYYTAEKRMKECALLKEITVVWSDTENKPPLDWEKTYGPKVVSNTDTKDSKNPITGPYVRFEVHEQNSLNNRFVSLQDVPTEAVLSIDDDLIIPCDTLAQNLRTWTSFPRALVGFSPRMHGYDALSGDTRYLRWQHTWWSGVYSIMLTKAAFMHRDYLSDFQRLVPQAFLQHVDDVRNCEDLALAYVAAKQTNAAPVWANGIVYEVSGQNLGGISAGGSHFETRSECLGKLRELAGDFPWVTGYQKVVPLGIEDW